MKTDEVPQDPSLTHTGLRKLFYAVDSQGDYAEVQSVGWDVESYATLAAVEVLNQQRDDAWARASAGLTAPLEFHMYQRRMDRASFAAATGFWRWRTSRHFRPAVFARLPDKILNRYAEVLGLTVEALRTLPAAPDA
ncbi:MAG: hypothetical protein EON85_01045 [Brevundimonas sp.]|nr:MAG: hypothetical protein EON85_01045 [Brevundimonas sp.]